MSRKDYKPSTCVHCGREVQWDYIRQEWVHYHVIGQKGVHGERLCFANTKAEGSNPEEKED